MVLASPHDIVKVKQGGLVDDPSLPLWAKEVLLHSAYHVVRRAPPITHKIPIGIRGNNRGERFGTYLALTEIEAVFSPQSLAISHAWETWRRKERFPLMVETLSVLSHVLKAFEWGIGGSLGYELTTEVPSISETSDIDIILYQSKPIDIDDAKETMLRLDGLPTTVDVQVQNIKGAFHLKEYLGNIGKPILLKTEKGPILTHDLF